MGIEERFATLVQEFAAEPDVDVPAESSPRRFGSDALKVNGSIFAMAIRGRLVVKLPRERVNALIGDGTGAPFENGNGHPMKEWLTLVDDDQQTWLTLTREAMNFVRSRSPRR